jgi:hypothetical protein
MQGRPLVLLVHDMSFIDRRYTKARDYLITQQRDDGSWEAMRSADAAQEDAARASVLQALLDVGTTPGNTPGQTQPRCAGASSSCGSSAGRWRGWSGTAMS